MRASTLWPASIVGVLGVFVGANALMFIAANREHAEAVEPDYYHRAVAWDSTRAEQERSAALGWRVTAVFGAPGPDGTPLLVRIADRAGGAVAADSVAVTAIHNAIADRPVHARLARGADGDWTASLPLARPGLWELRLAASRGADRFECSQRLDAAAANAGPLAAERTSR